MLVSTSGPRTRTCRCFARLWFCRGVFGWWSCGGVFVLVFLVFLWWWCGGGVFVVSTSGPRTHTFRCFARLLFCRGVFGVFVVLFGVLQDCGHTWCFSRQLLADNLICSGPCFHIASVWLRLQPPRV